MESIYKFFEDNLNNVTASISIGSVSLEGHMEGTCLLKVPNKFQGVDVYSELKWNELHFKEVVRNAILSNKEDFDYKDLDKIMDKLVPEIENQWVKIGVIRPYGIKSINSNFHKEKLYSVYITYEDGSICKIQNICKL